MGEYIQYFRPPPDGSERTIALGGINQEPCLRLELLAARWRA